MRLSSLVVAALIASSAGAAPWEVPLPPAGHFVVDETQSLDAATIAELDAIASAIDDSGTGQLGIAVVPTTSGIVPRTFGTNLFNHWGIGHASKDDGVLILVAVNDRKAELIVGTSEPLPSHVTDAIMRDDIVANMKRKDLKNALVSAARSVQRELAARARPAQPTVPHVDEELARYLRSEKAFPDRTPRSWVMDLSGTLSASQRARLDVIGTELYAETQGRLVFLVVSTPSAWPTVSELVDVLERQLGPGKPLGIVATNLDAHDVLIRLPPGVVSSSWDRSELERVMREMLGREPIDGLEHAGHFTSTALRTGIAPRPMSDVLREARARFGWFGWAFAAAFAVVGAWFGRRWNRNRIRSCEECQQPRERLDDNAEDAHLSPGQKSEESLRSVDYDVWHCGRCNDVLVLRYGALFSSYGSCNSCGHKTASSSSRTISHATEYSTGSVEVTERCAHCSHVNTYTRTTARLTPRSTSSSSSWSSSRSSGSFGGGSSSGSGSSGSW